MKLLNCSTLRIEEFFGSLGTRQYAILSHRWEAGEVTYQEISNPQGLDQKAGWAKIREACRIALVMGLDHIWVDTCCINKQDFTELNEAIISMFKWYAKAAVCFAYLSDVGPRHSSLENSLWFTRGWTLQELIAPRKIEFFDRKWNLIGTRAELCNEIHQRTGIDREILLHEPSSEASLQGLLDRIPVARRLSWASGRTTNREEDIAYSLLGIFGIQMPLLYGEGKNAFLRLQMEIMKETKDMTLFAWTWCPENPGHRSPPEYRGILATCPREFEGASKVVLTRDIMNNPEYSMTNKGLRISTELNIGRDKTHYYLGLGCRQSEWESNKSLGISLESQGGGVFRRSQPDHLFSLDDDAATEVLTLYINKHMDTEQRPSVVVEHDQIFRQDTEPTASVVKERGQTFRDAYRFHFNLKWTKLIRAVPESMWNQKRKMFSTKGLDSFEGFVEFERGSRDTFIVACGFTSQDTRWVHIASKWGIHSQLYHAAMRGNMKEMQELGQRRSRSVTKHLEGSKWSSTEAIGRIRLQKSGDGRNLDVYVYDDDVHNKCLVM